MIHQENRGLGGARNTGIEAALGEWILFPDSDDWLEPETLERALRAGERAGADIAAFAFRTVDEAGRELSAARYDLQVAEGQRRAAEDAVLKGQGEVRQYEVLLEGVRTSAENLEGEQEALTQRLADNRLQQQTVRQEIGTHEAEAASLRESAREKLAGQTDLQAYSNQLSGEMSQRKEQLAGLRAQRTAGAEALERMERTCPATGSSVWRGWKPTGRRLPPERRRPPAGRRNPHPCAFRPRSVRRLSSPCRRPVCGWSRSAPPWDRS